MTSTPGLSMEDLSLPWPHLVTWVDNVSLGMALPFLIAKVIKNITAKMVPPDGGWETSPNSLLWITKIGDLTVMVVPHCTLKPVWELCGVMTFGMSQGILLRRRWQILPHSSSRCSGMMISRQTPLLIPSVNQRYLNNHGSGYHLLVHPFVPNPMRCFKCQCFAHGLTTPNFLPFGPLLH